ncbi:Dinitrogenase iron-molybdenum cofactor [anaerobic digester metagenome]
MKVAITSTGNSLESLLDQRFGRCACFVVYDTESGSTEFIPNPHKNAEDSAGPASVQLITSRKVDKVISGEFGAKIKGTLDSMKIQLIVLRKQGVTIGHIIKMLNHTKE